MEKIFRKNKKNIKIVKVITKKDLLKYQHLNLRGEIIIRKDVNCYIPEIDLCFENYFPATVRVWASDFNEGISVSSAESDGF